MLSAHSSKNGAGDITHNGGNSRPTLIFLHIPKAAGTTFSSILEPKVAPNRIFVFRNTRTDVDRLKALPEAERAQLQLITGHLAYGIHQHLSQPCEYITILRDPVERIISHYYYILRSPEHYLYPKVTSQKMSLKEYVLAKLGKEMDNWQVRMIAGCNQLSYGACSHASLELAKENLQARFSLVGLAERFDETVLLAARKFGWDKAYYVRQNVTERRPRRQELPRDVIDAIEDVSRLDLELYAFAQELFRTQLRRLGGPLFNLKVAQFKAGNSRRAQKRALERPATFLSSSSLKPAPDI